MLIHDPRSSVVEAQVWESDIRRVEIGRPVEIWADAFKTSALGRGKPFRGRVIRINPTTYSGSGGPAPERFFTRRERKVPVKIALKCLILACEPACWQKSSSSSTRSSGARTASQVSSVEGSQR